MWGKYATLKGNIVTWMVIEHLNKADEEDYCGYFCGLSCPRKRRLPVGLELYPNLGNDVKPNPPRVSIF
jgi:hypothetical protein